MGAVRSETHARMKPFCNKEDWVMRFTLTLIAASTALVACGGGGGSSPASPPSVATQATLTPANYVAVAQEALSSNAYLLDATSLVVGAQVSDPSVLVRFSQDQLSKVPRWFANAPVQAVGATQTFTEPCAGGGTLTLVENDLNGNQQVDPGDSVSLTANNCSFEGVLLNGQLSLTLNSVTGNLDGYPYTLSATFNFQNLAAQSTTERVVGNGSMSMNINARSGFDQTIALGIASFAITSTYGGATYNQTLKDYDTSLILSPSGSSATWTSSVRGTLISSAFDSKSVYIETPVAFVRSGTQSYPASGNAIITGAAGAKIRVTATSASTVTIDLDADGNGSYETTVNKFWNEIL